MTSSTLLYSAAALMALSGILMAVSASPALIRLAWVLFCTLGGSGVLAYIIAAIIIPEAPAGGVQ